MTSKTLPILTIFKHLLIWLLSIYLLSSSDLKWGWTISSAYDDLLPQVCGAVTNVAIFYFTSFYLIPRFFNSSCKRAFYAYSVLILIVISLLELGPDPNLPQRHGGQGFPGRA